MINWPPSSRLKYPTQERSMTVHKSSHKPKKKLAKSKARKILRDGEVRGKALTKKQRGFFGARSAGKPVKKKGGGK